MNHATQTALRAIIMALENAKIINEQAVDQIVLQLRIAADGESDADRQDEADELRTLADDVESDARLDLPLG
ncbi:MAG: hypothetical protein ACXWUP_07480 [Allosphingosinicella sp.]